MFAYLGSKWGSKLHTVFFSSLLIKKETNESQLLVELPLFLSKFFTHWFCLFLPKYIQHVFCPNTTNSYNYDVVSEEQKRKRTLTCSRTQMWGQTVKKFESIFLILETNISIWKHFWQNGQDTILRLWGAFWLAGIKDQSRKPHQYFFAGLHERAILPGATGRCKRLD